MITKILISLLKNNKIQLETESSAWKFNIALVLESLLGSFCASVGLNMVLDYFVFHNNLLMIKNELIRYPNEDYYLEIDTRDKFYTVCNLWSKNRALENLNLKIAVATTSIY